ncbi:arginine transport system permease protein ArtQ [Clostridium tepidiprofundi DSM 19306]|uniref:Arginine transport system permease protein ArtQ n=1 Tax=Clostridium tepidiprofundi DSM 19306 TaxID=1121338 RepID=A0A151B3F1_9CLOT|nr:amino acid ABC transporter permease [Clostridium tepidiprofundi]KYH34282.1 arginine transport system permease protein ArtQ [Clostridium tepidiprofundi DSM 19306]
MSLNFLIKYSHFFISGTKITLIISLFTIIIGVTLGIVFAIMRISKNVILHSLATAYIEFIRGTPLLVQLYIIYYGLPLLGIQLPSVSIISDNFSDILAAIIALSINSSAYSAEIFRAGIQAVDKGQMEAARSLGMSYKTAMFHIILPQALKNVLPAIGNEFVSIIKESAIVSVIGIHELMFNADTVRGITFKPFSPLIISAIIYFLITFTLSKFIKIGERRLNLND